MVEGRASEAIARGSAVIETGIERMTGNPLESVTRILIVLLVKFEAKPPNTPVVEFIERPRGRSPLADHL